MINNLLWFLSVGDVLGGVKVGGDLLGMRLAMVVGLGDAWTVEFNSAQVALLLGTKGKQGGWERPDLHLLAVTDLVSTLLNNC